MEKVLRVAACQMIVTADVSSNLGKMAAAIQSAVLGGADVVAFPECAVTGYPPLYYDHPSEIDLSVLPEAHLALRSWAREAGICIIVGTIRPEGQNLFNTALVIGDDGSMRGSYDKLHLMEGDEPFFLLGCRLPLFDMDGIPFGLQICYDARFPEPFRLLKSAGAKVIFNLSNACGSDTWKIPVLEGVYRARASENGCYVVAVNAAGPLQMAVSRILDVNGLSLADANQDVEELIFADLDLSLVGPGHFEVRRTDLYDVSATDRLSFDLKAD